MSKRRALTFAIALCAGGPARASDSPAFPDNSFENGVVGWSFEGGKPLLLHACVQSQEAPSSQLRIDGKPLTSLGGNYWDVPFPALLDDGQVGNCWLDVPNGVTVRSPAFDVPAAEHFVTVLVRAFAPGDVIELHTADDQVLATLKVPVTDSLRPLSLDAKSAVKGVTLVVRTLAGSAQPLRLDEVRRASQPRKADGKDRKGESKPDGLWGFADTHTHPMANLGFGGSLFYGAADAEWKGKITCRHDWGGGGDVNKSMITEHIEPAGHAGMGGYPDFQYWPRFNSVLHQQLHVNWLKRAWRGGLRLIVFHAVNNALLARYFVGHGDYEGANDMVAVKREIVAMKKMVGNHDFMEIAYNPADARRIVGAGKLAVILGVEVDTLFSCHEAEGVLSEQKVKPLPPRPCTEAYVQKSLDDLYAMGIRHVFPIHLIDNDFGGTALYSTAFARLNHWITGKDIVPNRPQPDQHVYLSLSQGWDFWGDFFGPLFANMGGAMGNFSFPNGPHVNSLGLKPLGEKFVEALWDKGVIVDVDHMSEWAMDKVVDMAKKRGVSVVAGHTGFRELMFGEHDSSINSKIASENAKSNHGVEEIHQVGGVIGIGTAPSDVLATHFGSVPNDCGGSSRSFTQLYLYAVGKKSKPLAELPGFVGVTLGTDMHFQEQLFPRFGTWACLGKHQGMLANEPDTKRSLKASDDQSGYDVRADSEEQDHAVSYRTPARTFYNTRFKTPNGDYFSKNVRANIYDQIEAAALQALLVMQSGKDPLGKEVQQYTHNDVWGVWSLDIGRMEQFALGFAQTEEQQAHDGLPKGGCHDINPHTHHKYACDYFTSSDCFGCGERRAAYLAKTGHDKAVASDIDSVRAATNLYLPRLRRVWKKFERMKAGGNEKEPLERCEGDSCGGSREYDFNLDGLAHYGLIPDLLQDVSNQLRAQKKGDVHDLRALFHGADDYIRAWDRIWAKRR